jgi:hypothetical protein
MPKELHALMLRYCQLGRLLPRIEDLVDEGPRADAEVVLAEMATVKAQIDSFIAAARAALPEAERAAGDPA